ncbi:hypothetical protein [Salipiger bermudensis]|uniref:hypothetical protein n=1 Tax=Salipiger bermudensis TaxID=344736 RepID=UPI00300AE05D
MNNPSNLGFGLARLPWRDGAGLLYPRWQYAGRFVGGVLGDEVACEGVLQDGLAQGDGAGEFGLADLFRNPYVGEALSIRFLISARSALGGKVIATDIPKVACNLTPRSSESARRTSVACRERYIWPCKRLELRRLNRPALP